MVEVRLSSSFLVVCLRSWSLKAGLRGPISDWVVGLGLVKREGRLSGSFWAEGSSGAPVSFWTTARKVDGSAWTKVVVGETGSDPYVGEFILVEITQKSGQKGRNISGKRCVECGDFILVRKIKKKKRKRTKGKGKEFKIFYFLFSINTNMIFLTCHDIY